MDACCCRWEKEVLREGCVRRSVSSSSWLPNVWALHRKPWGECCSPHHAPWVAVVCGLTVHLWAAHPGCFCMAVGLLMRSLL